MVPTIGLVRTTHSPSVGAGLGPVTRTVRSVKRFLLLGATFAACMSVVVLWIAFDGGASAGDVLPALAVVWLASMLATPLLGRLQQRLHESTAHESASADGVASAP